ncbi:4-(cytidine 5'-diphospho)-2-C-methyl-D-erythritol kinase, partial [Porcipelethomonas sp.]|uniref:4-(cytidine 5'-diphospho)-2-C-methyl-D-erythritol kinase n=1 Tax=Porcipelethomonas sp. TaxID=2981675 RepID=UPI003EF6D7E3
MNSIKVKASAKINLTLDVTGKTDNGYHLIESIFQSIGIYDYLTISKTEYGIILSCDTPGIPCDSSNIAYKAAKLFLDETGIDSGVKIDIEKHIPSQAGLGGGSSDGAGVLFSMNRLFGTGMSVSDLAEIGKKVSADTTFFLYGGTAFVQGTGEIINSIRYIPPVNIVVAKGQSGISTPQAYKLIDSLENPAKIK